MKMYVDELPKRCKNCPMLETLHPYGDNDMEISALYCRHNKQQIEIEEYNIYLDYKTKPLNKYLNELNQSCRLKSLTEIKKQERERVIDECYKLLMDNWDTMKSAWQCNSDSIEIRNLLDKLKQEDTSND